jgi:hypothetical protein
MGRGKRQAAPSSTNAPLFLSSWGDIVQHVQQLLADDGKTMMDIEDICRVCRSIMLFTETLCDGDTYTPANSSREAKQMAAALPQLDLSTFVGKMIAGDPVRETSSTSSKWYDQEWVSMVGVCVAAAQKLSMTALALSNPGSGAPVTVQNACAAAIRESVEYQLLPSGVFKPLATALQQLTALLTAPQQQRQQQQQVAGDLIMIIQGVIGTFADMLVVKCQYSDRYSRELYRMTGGQVGVATVEAAGLCIAVLQHPERLCWQDDSGMGEFVYVTEETLSKLVYFLHTASESVLTLYDSDSLRYNKNDSKVFTIT